MKKVVVFTDLDGTLIDLCDQSFEAALPSLELLKNKKIPVVFCSAKTRAEQEHLRRLLSVKDPFIVENGGAIFIPYSYFDFDFSYSKKIDDYKVIELGISYPKIREKIKDIKNRIGIDVIGFGDLSEEEISKITGLSKEASSLAKKREYDETLILDNLSSKELKLFLEEVEKESLKWTFGGRFYHVHGNNDKGKAVEILKSLYVKKYNQKPLFVALGDTKNDISMFKKVDIGFLIQKKDGSWERIELPHIKRIDGIGPVGWSRAIQKLLSLFNSA